MDLSSAKWARRLAISAVLVAAGCHATMNYRFGVSLSSVPFDQYVFGVFSVAVDVAKLFALAFAAYAFEKRRIVKGLACILVWLTTITYSGAAAIGFAALARDMVVAGRTGDVNDYKANSGEQKRLTEQMEQARGNPLFAETYGCTDYNKAATKGDARKKAELCSGYWRADNALEELKPKVRQASLTDADPQTALLSRVTGYPRENVAVALAVFLAVVAEVLSSLGVWVFSVSRRRPERQQLRRPAIPIAGEPKKVLVFARRRAVSTEQRLH
jgi:hypothetical protein